MSLEQQISELKDAIVRLTAIIQAKDVPTVTVSAADYKKAAQEAVMGANALPIPATVAVSAPPSVIPTNPAPSLPPAPLVTAMPAPPSFLAAPAPAPVATLPFSDPKGLIEYVMETYKKLGRDKGAAIGDVLTKMGLKAINEVQPSQYAEFYAAVEAIK